MSLTTKKWTILLSTVLLAAGLTACGKNDADGASPGVAAPTASSSPSESAGETKQGSGEYVGEADSHTVEIKTEGIANAYQIGEGLENAFDDLNSGDQISFEYVEKALEGGGKQLVLTKVDKAGPGNASGGGSESAASDLPAAKSFTLKLEGNEEKQTGKLAQGQGFALYVFDGFTFDSMLSLLTMDVDKRYYAHVEKLPSGYKLEEIKKNAEQELAKVGEVRQVSGKEMDAAIGKAALMLIASNDKLTQEVIIKDVGGTGYRLDVNMPQGEPSEGFEPHVLASFGSITNS